MNDYYANGGHNYHCSDCWESFDGPTHNCPKCGKDGRSRQQRRQAGEDVDGEKAAMVKEAAGRPGVLGLIGAAKPMPLPPPTPAVTPAMVRANVPAAVLRDRPVFTDVTRGPGGAYTGANLGAPATPRHLAALDRMGRVTVGAGRPVFAYSAGPSVAGVGTGGRHIGVFRGTPDPVRSLRHEGYHGMVDLLRGGVPAAQVEGARWYHTAPARMRDSRFGLVRGLGLHGEEIGARVFGEGGLGGLRRGIGFAFKPPPYYLEQYARRSPLAARVARLPGQALGPAAVGSAAGAGALGGIAAKRQPEPPPPTTPFGPGR